MRRVSPDKKSLAFLLVLAIMPSFTGGFMKKALCLSLFLISKMFALANSFYVSPFAGLNLLRREEGGQFYDSEQHRIVNGSLEFHPGYAVGGRVGYQPLEAFRVEIEGAYRSNTPKCMRIGDRTSPLTGSVTKGTILGNSIIDLPVSQQLIPYVGCGMGHAWERIYLPGKNREGEDSAFDASQRGFAYQGIVGLVFCVAEGCMHAGAEYRCLSGDHTLVSHTIDFNLKRFF